MATTVRWGILATGGIAQTFTKDLLVDPTTRSVTHLKHTVVAAASSTSRDRAQTFLNDVGAPSNAKPYGSYADFVKDPEIDIVYVATPHSHHYQNVMLCLDAGKHVLCEKAFTANAAQLRILIDKARAKDLFLMEAVWTRYFPLSIYVRDTIKAGRLGPITKVSADNSMATDPENAFADDKHRMVNPDLAGGPLLDLGIYSLTWCFQCLYTVQDEGSRQKPATVSAMKKYRTGVDEMSTVLLTFPRPEEQGGDAHATAQTSIRAATDPDKKGSAGPSIRIQGDKGEMQVWPPAFRPTKTRLILKDGTVEDKEWVQPGPGKGSGWYNGFKGAMNADGEGHGMFWEADEAADGILKGRREGRYENLEESLTIMEVMDEVRRQGGMRLPERVETIGYPVDV